MVSIIVPIYYCSPALYQVIDRSLNSIKGLNNSHSPLELIFIDDYSPLELPGHWQVPDGLSKHSRNSVNLGFTATVNRGVSNATGEIIVIINDDIVLTRECLRRFKTLKGLQIASPADTSSSPDDRFGACWGMTREVYELLGPLNENYKHFYSDTDYYNRGKTGGVEIIKWPDITLDHPESSTYKHLDKETLVSVDRKMWEENQSV